MKTTQFKQEITKLGLKFEISSYTNHEYINIFTCDDDILASVSLSESWVCSLTQANIHKFKLTFREKLYDLLDEYSTTPISERHETSIEENVLTFIVDCLNENIPLNTALVILESSSLHYRCLIPFKMRKPHNYEELKNNHLIYEFYCTNARTFNKLWVIEEYKLNKGE